MKSEEARGINTQVQSSHILHVGPEHYVPVSKVIAILSMDTLPVKRLYNRAKDEANLIDVTHGKRSRSLVLLSNGAVVGSPVKAATLAKRFNDCHAIKEGGSSGLSDN